MKVGYLPTKTLFTNQDSQDCSVLTKFLHLFYRWVNRPWESYLMGLWPYGKSAGGPGRAVRVPASHSLPGAQGGYSWCFACLTISVKVNKLVPVLDFRRNWWFGGSDNRSEHRFFCEEWTSPLSSQFTCWDLSVLWSISGTGSSSACVQMLCFHYILWQLLFSTPFLEVLGKINASAKVPPRLHGRFLGVGLWWVLWGSCFCRILGASRKKKSWS